MTEMKIYSANLFLGSRPGRRAVYHEFYVASPTLPRKSMLLAHLLRERYIERKIDGRNVRVRILYPWSPLEGDSRVYEYDLVVAPRRYHGEIVAVDEDDIAIFERLSGKEVVVCPVRCHTPYRRREPEAIRAKAAISPKRRDGRKSRRY